MDKSEQEWGYLRAAIIFKANLLKGDKPVGDTVPMCSPEFYRAVADMFEQKQDE